MGCGIVIAAAGKGKRMGAGKNKQFILLNNKPILIHTLEKFSQKSWVDQIVIAAHPDERTQVEHLLQEYDIQDTLVVPGGNERQESIEKGLTFLQSEYVMVHDGARPFIQSPDLERLYEKVQQVDAVVFGVPVKDTIKVIDQFNRIRYTPDRKSLWAVQTPQAFRLSVLKEAYRKAKEENYLGTDDASLVERIGRKVEVIEGNYHNIKITTPEDLVLAQAILNHWGESM